jgi:hypothetical protein
MAPGAAEEADNHEAESLVASTSHVSAASEDESEFTSAREGHVGVEEDDDDDNDFEYNPWHHIRDDVDDDEEDEFHGLWHQV